MRAVATKFCPSCGDEFVATAETCPDCEVSLVDERPAGVDESRTGQVTYELHDWAGESRVMLESLLAGQRVPHAWEGTNLIAPAALESKVDALVDQVAVTTEPNLDPDAPKVAYELADWDDEQQTELIQALDAKGIPYDFDVDGSLVVHESDDTVVEAVFDDLTAGDETDGVDEVDETDEADAEADGDVAAAATGAADAEEDLDDGDDGIDGEAGDEPLAYEDSGLELDAQMVMSGLFDAADRLRKKAGDHQGILTMVERAADAERMRLPFGFNRRDWDEIVGQAAALRDLIEDDESADDDITAHAAVLRGTLRPYV
jgi:hypothetical protein